LTVYLYLAEVSGKYAEAVYVEALAWKGIVFRRSRLERTGTQTPETLEIFRRLQRTATQLSRLAWTSPQPRDERNWRERVAKLSTKKEQLEAELSARSAEYRQANRQVRLEEVQTALPQDAVLFDFIEYRHYTPADKKAGTKETWERRLLGFVLGPGRPVQMVPLGPMQPIDDAIETWRVTFGMSPQGSAAGRRLRERLWEPLEGKLQGAKIVFLSPDGALSRLPFGALPGKTPGSYLIEERTFALVPVPQLIPELVNEEGRKQLQKNLLLMGNINYDAEPSKAPASPERSDKPRSILPAGRMHFGPLPGTRGEVVAIEKIYREDVGREGVTTLQESQASKQAFLAEARKFGYLHLATHGFFIPEKLPLPRAVATRGADQFAELLGRPEAAGMYPAILSGLALAGANRTGQLDATDTSDNRDDSGILTAEEIGTQNLDGVQLVVLSACETGLGKSAGGEGVLGLQRAFQSAGARNVVASLWPVDDKATAALMTEFYTMLWKEHKSPIDALREAQLYIYRHPDEIGKLAGDRTFNLNPNKLMPIPTDRAAQPLKTASPELWAGFVLSGVGKVETPAKPPAGSQEMRTWKRKDGKKAELRFVAVEGENVKLQRADGKTYLVLLKTLSDEDQQWVGERGTK
jgi:CHAT domain-containing protein